MKGLLIIVAALALFGFAFFTGSNDTQTMMSNMLGMTRQQVSLTPVQQAYIDFKAKFARKYSIDEDQYRYKIFADKYQYINDYNANSTNVKLAINKFSDLTLAEFKATYMGRRDKGIKGPVKSVKLEGAAPAQVDWLTAGAVTPVKNQAQCGSCWAFSTVGGLEGAHFLSTGTLTSFSEQQIVSCSKQNDGCNGGDLPPAYQYVVDTGVTTEANYPYTSSSGFTGLCKKAKIIAPLYQPTGYTMVTPNSGTALQAAVVQQPVSVCIEADSDVFQSYSSGVLTSSACGTELDHCVTAIGYNTQATIPYWIVKNSWGSDWGQAGYVWIEQQLSDTEGVCGINEEPGYPNIQ